MPGEPPRTSVAHAAPSGRNEKTVQPVGPSSYSAQPISRPGSSNSSAGPSKLVRGVRSAVSFVNRATAASLDFGAVRGVGVIVTLMAVLPLGFVLLRRNL